MLRIIHFSDFHLNRERNLESWNFFVKDALIGELKNINNDIPIDFIFLTGDLIDKGGKSFKTISEALSEFEKQVIIPIITELNMPIERFLIIPGNHDVDKDIEPIWDDMGLRTYFKSPDEIQSFIRKGKEGDYKGFERIKPFKEFEKNLYKNVTACQLSCFDSNFIFKINGLKIGVSCLNSSWRCYDSTLDKGLIIVGETQIGNSYAYIKDCDVKIALIHHPYDWVSDVENKVIHSHLISNYDLMFLGHVHEGETKVETSYVGSLFINIAPGALTDIRSDRHSQLFVLLCLSLVMKRMLMASYLLLAEGLKEFQLRLKLI